MTAEPSNDQLLRAAEFRAHGYWDDTSLPRYVDRWADDDPDHPFLSDGVSQFTYGEFRAQARDGAVALDELLAGSRDTSDLPPAAPPDEPHLILYSHPHTRLGPLGGGAAAIAA